MMFCKQNLILDLFFFEQLQLIIKMSECIITVIAMTVFQACAVRCIVVMRMTHQKNVTSAWIIFFFFFFFLCFIFYTALFQMN